MLIKENCVILIFSFVLSLSNKNFIFLEFLFSEKKILWKDLNTPVCDL